MSALDRLRELLNRQKTVGPRICTCTPWNNAVPPHDEDCPFYDEFRDGVLWEVQATHG